MTGHEPGGGPEPEPRSVLDPPAVFTPPPAFEPSAAPTEELEPVPARRPMRLGTVVFGLALLTMAVVSGVGALAEIRPSFPLVAVAILIGAGFVLVVGGLSAAVRETTGRSRP